jgi:hypothetical protein
MYIFPLIALAVSLIFALELLTQYLQKNRPYQLAWSLAMFMFALASLAEAFGLALGWNSFLVKLWYLFGGALVVGYLALGTLYIQEPKVARRLLVIGAVITLLGPVLPMVIFNKEAVSAEKIPVIVVFLAATVYLALASRKDPATTSKVWLQTLLVASLASLYLIVKAPVNTEQVTTLGWEAMTRSLMLKALVASLNTLGSVVLIGGALYSAYVLFGKGILTERALGTLLIGVGALINALGGFVHGYFQVAGQAVLSVALAVGIVVMYLGFVQASKPVTVQNQSPAANTNQ